MLGRFHEISIQTADIRASVDFYERLGFTQAHTGDTFTHPYGVLTDGRVYLGLHERNFESPELTFVRANVAAYAAELLAKGLKLAYRRTAEDEFHRIGLLDPAGQMLALIEARTYSPAPRAPKHASLCGHFAEFSIAGGDFPAAQAFWEPLGFVATEEAATPYAHLALTSDHLDIAFHRPRTCERSMLVFRDPEMRARVAKLRDLRVGTWRTAPAGLDPDAHAFLEAPEGTPLLLLEEDT